MRGTCKALLAVKIVCMENKQKQYSIDLSYRKPFPLYKPLYLKAHLFVVINFYDGVFQ